MHAGFCFFGFVIIWLKVRLQPHIEFTLWGGDLAVYTCSVTTPPKLNRFGEIRRTLDYIVGGWPGQIFGRDPRSHDDVERQAKILFIFVS